MALIAHWPLNGNTNDISGNGYNLTSSGGSYVNGKIGQAYLSDLSTEYLYIPASHNNFQNIFNNNFSISFWYYANTGTENTNRGLLQYGLAALDTQLHLLLRASGNYFAIGFYGDDYESTFVPTLGTWNHYTVIGDKNNGKQKLYINGQFHGERTTTGWLNTPNSQFYLAYYVANHPNGMMNDVRIYDHVLTDYEIKELAKAKILHYTFDDPYEEPTTNLIPGDNGINSYPNFGNDHGTYNTNQYNNNTHFSIGTIGNIANNIVTLSSIGTPIYTYDVLNPQTTGGGVTAGTSYFIKKLSDTQFTLHEYNGSQDGSQGYINPATGNYKVYDSIANDVRIPISASGFPTMWYGYAHMANSSLVKEIIPNAIGTETETFHGHSFIRCHTGHKSNTVGDYMAYGVYPPVTAGLKYTFSFWYRASDVQSIGATFNHTAYTTTDWPSYSGTLTATAAWKKAEWTATAPGTGGTNMYWSGLANGKSIDISEIQVEQKTQATPFTLSTRPGGVIDISGYKNHGTISAIAESPKWVSDSKVGSGSIYFNGTNPHIISGLTNLGGLTTVTISFWRKNDTTITHWLPFVGQTTSHYIMATSSGTGGFYHHNIGSSWEIFKDGVPQGPLVAATPFTDQLWHHYVIRGVDLSAWTQFRINGYTGAWDNEGYFDDIRVYNTNLSNADIKDLYEVRAEISNSGTLQTYDFKQRTNLLQSVNQAIKDKQFKDGLSAYTQANTNVTLTDRGYRIYRTPNVNPTDNGNTMWGGLKINMTEIPGGIPLTKGRSYRLIINTNGKTSNPSNGSSKFTNLMGWGGGGLNPTPITIGREWEQIPNNFNGKHDIIWEFKIEDDIYKVCTSSYSSFVAGNTYPSYNHLQMGWTYQNTGSEGTEIYITGIYLYDITDDDSIGISDKGIGTFDEYSTVGITDGLVGYWPLNGNAKDYSGNGYHGVDSNISYQAGKSNNMSAFYTQDTSEISIAGVPVEEKWTSMATIFHEPDFLTYETVMRGDGSERYMILLTHGRIDVWDSGLRTYGTHQPLETGWNHITTTSDGTLVKIYLNGELIASGGSSKSANVTTIGRYPGRTNETFFGKIQDVKFFNRALTEEEIAIEYNTMFNNEVQIHESGVLYAKDLRQY